jgi:hypothetical protein
MTQRKYPAREDIPGFTAESAEDVLFAELAVGSTEPSLIFFLLHYILFHNINDFGVRRRPGRRTLMVQPVRGIVPVQLSDAAVSVLVRVGHAVILIERELGIGSGIDAHLRDLLHLAGALDRGAQETGSTRTQGCRIPRTFAPPVIQPHETG